MNILSIVNMFFRTVFNLFYMYQHTTVFGNVTVDLVIFYFFIIILIIAFIRKLVL